MPPRGLGLAGRLEWARLESRPRRRKRRDGGVVEGMEGGGRGEGWRQEMEARG